MADASAAQLRLLRSRGGDHVLGEFGRGRCAHRCFSEPLDSTKAAVTPCRVCRVAPFFAKTGLSPHAPSDIFFVGSDSVGVDDRGGELGVTEPFLHQVQGDAGRHSRHPKTMPEPLG